MTKGFYFNIFPVKFKRFSASHVLIEVSPESVKHFYVRIFTNQLKILLYKSLMQVNCTSLWNIKITYFHDFVIQIRNISDRQWVKWMDFVQTHTNTYHTSMNITHIITFSIIVESVSFCLLQFFFVNLWINFIINFLCFRILIKKI